MFVDSSTPLVDSMVEEVSSLYSEPNLFEGQGLCIQTIVFHSSCAKAASSGIRASTENNIQNKKWFV